MSAPAASIANCVPDWPKYAWVDAVVRNGLCTGAVTTMLAGESTAPVLPSGAVYVVCAARPTVAIALAPAVGVTVHVVRNVWPALSVGVDVGPFACAVQPDGRVSCVAT